MPTNSAHVHSKLLSSPWSKDNKLANIWDTLLGADTEHSSKTALSQKGQFQPLTFKNHWQIMIIRHYGLCVDTTPTTLSRDNSYQ